jgi:Mg2+ and Co2+ transporter CorA
MNNNSDNNVFDFFSAKNISNDQQSIYPEYAVEPSSIEEPPVVSATNEVYIKGEGERKEKEKMSDYVSRGELDARLELIESKIDARIGRIELIAEQMKEQNKQIADEFHQDKRDRLVENKSLKVWMLGAALTVVVGIVAIYAPIALWANNNAMEVVKANNSTLESKLSGKIDQLNDKIDKSNADTDAKLQKQKAETLSDIKTLLTEMNQQKK